jgi:uridine kinase
MRGDRLVIRDEHRRAASGIVEILLPEIGPERIAWSLAGESGSGKSEIASVLSELLKEKGIRCAILQQDDYFVHPPETNARLRRENIEHVGVSEVRLDVLDSNLREFKGGTDRIRKPLVLFDEDRITEETLDLTGVRILIAEGTYTSLLEGADRRIFIERTCEDTREARLKRAREVQDDHLERVLHIEHRIISTHASLADVLVGRDYGVRKNE